MRVLDLSGIEMDGESFDGLTVLCKQNSELEQLSLREVIPKEGNEKRGPAIRRALDKGSLLLFQAISTMRNLIAIDFSFNDLSP